jgi:hypothetical protein
MAGKTKRKFVVRLIKRNKKTMKGGVACQSATLFKYSNNSCYLDTTLIGWLHFADADLRADLEVLAVVAEGNKKRLIENLIEIYDSLKLYGPGPAKDIKGMTALREEFRNILQQCEDFTNLMPIPDLTHTQAADEIFTSLTNYIGVNNIKINNNYRGFRGYTEQEKNILMAQNPGRNRNQIDTFDPDLPEPPPRESTVEKINIIILKPAEGSLSPQELVSTPLESRRNNVGDDYYIVEQTIVGTVYGILPISVERRIYDSNNDTLRNQTEISLESHINLEDDGIYQLVSVICFVSDPDHYVAYYKCDQGDNWIFYDDLGIDLNKMIGGTDCKEDIQAIFTEWLEKYSEFVSEKLGEFEKFDDELSTIINESEDIITINKYEDIIRDSLKTELLLEIIEQICDKKNYDIKDIFKNWWKNTVLHNAREQWNTIQETEIYKESKAKKSKGKSPKQQEYYDKFKRFENSRKEVVHILIELLGLKKAAKPAKPARPARPAKPAKPARPPRTATNNPLYMDMGRIENWQNSLMPGYTNSPREAATLLFYKKDRSIE